VSCRSGPARHRRPCAAVRRLAVRGPPDATQKFVECQIDGWAKVVKDNGIKAD